MVEFLNSMIFFVENVSVLPKMVRPLHHVRQNQSYVIAGHRAVVVRLTGPIFRHSMNVDEEIERFFASLIEFRQKKLIEPDLDGSLGRHDVDVNNFIYLLNTKLKTLNMPCIHNENIKNVHSFCKNYKVLCPNYIVQCIKII